MNCLNSINLLQTCHQTVSFLVIKAVTGNTRPWMGIDVCDIGNQPLQTFLLVDDDDDCYQRLQSCFAVIPLRTVEKNTIFNPYSYNINVQCKRIPEKKKKKRSEKVKMGH